MHIRDTKIFRNQENKKEIPPEEPDFHQQKRKKYSVDKKKGKGDPGDKSYDKSSGRMDKLIFRHGRKPPPPLPGISRTFIFESPQPPENQSGYGERSNIPSLFRKSKFLKEKIPLPDKKRKPPPSGRLPFLRKKTLSANQCFRYPHLGQWPSGARLIPQAGQRSRLAPAG